MKSLGTLATLLVGALLLPPAASAISPTGEVRVMDRPDRLCPYGAQCYAFAVQCPSLQVARGFIAIHDVPSPQGLVVLHGGGSAARYWSSSGFGRAALDSLHAEGLATVQIRWQSGWSDPSGTDAGPRLLSCRPATVVQWIHDNIYQDLEVRSGPGACGFCYTGNSAGAAAIAYALAYYGAEQWLDAAVLTSGPPFSDLDGACMDDEARRSLRFDQPSAARIDEMYGHPYPGPCARSDGTWQSRWQHDSLDGAGGDWNYPTHLHLILGGQDDTGAVPHARHYADQLHAHGMQAKVDVVPAMGHSIQQSPQGLAILLAAMTASDS